METRAHYALIGAFTLAVIAAAFSFVYWFSGADKNAARKTYKLVFSSSVSGLSRGGLVLFNGLRVGEVTKLELGEDPRLVNALIEIDQRTPVKTDTKARLEYQGLTGVGSVALIGGSANADPLERGPNGELPTINAERSEFQNIVETLQNLSGKVDSILDKADRLVGENSGALTETVRNVQRFSESLADTGPTIREVIENFAEIERGLKPFVETLERNSDAIEATLKDARGIAAKLSAAADKIEGLMVSAQNLLGGPGTKTVVDEVGDAAKAIRKLAENLDVRTRDLTAGINKVTGPTRRQYEALAGDARRTLDELNRTVRSLEKNPQQLIFGAKPTVPEYSGR